jgi:hypothetical protein
MIAERLFHSRYSHGFGDEDQSRVHAAEVKFSLLAFQWLYENYSGTRVDVSRNRNVQVDATLRERRPCTKFKRDIVTLVSR